jgi:hypothetical protein
VLVLQGVFGLPVDALVSKLCFALPILVFVQPLLGAASEARGGLDVIGRPIILTVDDDPAVLATITRDLRRCFGSAYRMVGATSGLRRWLC